MTHNTEFVLAMLLGAAIATVSMFAQQWLDRRSRDPKRGRQEFIVELARRGKRIETVIVRANTWGEAIVKAPRCLLVNTYALRVTTGGVTYRVGFDAEHGGVLVPVDGNSSKEG